MGATAATVPKLITWAPVGKSVSSVSPFGAKIEVAMRLAGIDYTVAAGDPTNSKTFVKQKFPVLQVGDKIIPDSSSIFQYLEETYPDKMTLFTPSDAKTKAYAQALQRMLEEHAYFGVLYGLWHKDEVAMQYSPQLMKTIPAVEKSPVMRAMLPVMRMTSKSKLVRDLNGQGLGRHSMKEVLSRLDADLTACSTLLEDSGAFLTGTTPVQADCFLFGLLDHGINACGEMTVPFVHTHLIKEKPALMDFHTRVAAKLFPDGRSEKCSQNLVATHAGYDEVNNSVVVPNTSGQLCTFPEKELGPFSVVALFCLRVHKTTRDSRNFKVHTMRKKPSHEQMVACRRSVYSSPRLS